MSLSVRTLSVVKLCNPVKTWLNKGNILVYVVEMGKTCKLLFMLQCCLVLWVELCPTERLSLVSANVTFYGNAVFADVVILKCGHTREGGPRCNDWCPHKKRKQIQT